MSFKGNLSQLLRTPLARRFQKALRNPEQAQWTKLKEILENNANTEFGQAHGFDKISSVADYQAQVPIQNYEAIRPWVQRMLEGESNVLTFQDPIYYCVTSGTSGVPKPSPITPAYRDEYQSVVQTFLYYVYAETPEAFDHQILYFNGSAEIGKTPAGIDTGTMSGFNSKNLPPLLKKFYAVPYELMTIQHTESRHFCVALLALAQRVSMMIAITASPMILFAQTLQKEGERLLHHLEKGTLPEDIQLSSAERALIESRLKPRPERARELRQLYVNQQLEPVHIWPELSLMICWKSSSAGSLVPTLERYFPNIPIQDAIYSATEGWCNVPYTRKHVGGPLAIHAHFYEFIDIHDAAERVKQVHELEPGKQYRIIYTTNGGMYRYDIGDIMAVSHYVHNTPSVYFVRKAGEFSNMGGEHLDGAQVVKAVQAASQDVKHPLAFYAMVPDSTQFPPHYRLYIEPERALSPEQQARFAAYVDAHLGNHNAEYLAKRQDAQLNSVQVYMLDEGSLAKWRQHRVRGGADEAQLKPPSLLSGLDKWEALGLNMNCTN